MALALALIGGYPARAVRLSIHPFERASYLLEWLKVGKRWIGRGN